MTRHLTAYSSCTYTKEIPLGDAIVVVCWKVFVYQGVEAVSQAEEVHGDTFKAAKKQDIPTFVPSWWATAPAASKKISLLQKVIIWRYNQLCTTALIPGLIILYCVFD